MAKEAIKRSGESPKKIMQAEPVIQGPADFAANAIDRGLLRSTANAHATVEGVLHSDEFRERIKSQTDTSGTPEAIERNLRLGTLVLTAQRLNEHATAYFDNAVTRTDTVLIENAETFPEAVDAVSNDVQQATERETAIEEEKAKKEKLAPKIAQLKQLVDLGALDASAIPELPEVEDYDHQGFTGRDAEIIATFPTTSTFFREALEKVTTGKAPLKPEFTSADDTRSGVSRPEGKPVIPGFSDTDEVTRSRPAPEPAASSAPDSLETHTGSEVTPVNETPNSEVALTFSDGLKKSQKKVTIQVGNTTEEILVPNRIAEYIKLLQEAGEGGIDKKKLVTVMNTTGANLDVIAFNARKAFKGKAIRPEVQFSSKDRYQRRSGNHVLIYETQSDTSSTDVDKSVKETGKDNPLIETHTINAHGKFRMHAEKEEPEPEPEPEPEDIPLLDRTEDGVFITRGGNIVQIDDENMETLALQLMDHTDPENPISRSDLMIATGLSQGAFGDVMTDLSTRFNEAGLEYIGRMPSSKNKGGYYLREKPLPSILKDPDTDGAFRLRSGETVTFDFRTTQVLNLMIENPDLTPNQLARQIKAVTKENIDVHNAYNYVVQARSKLREYGIGISDAGKNTSGTYRFYDVPAKARTKPAEDVATGEADQNESSEVTTSAHVEAAASTATTSQEIVTVHYGTLEEQGITPATVFTKRTEISTTTEASITPITASGDLNQGQEVDLATSVHPTSEAKPTEPREFDEAAIRDELREAYAVIESTRDMGAYNNIDYTFAGVVNRLSNQGITEDFLEELTANHVLKVKERSPNTKVGDRSYKKLDAKGIATALVVKTNPDLELEDQKRIQEVAASEHQILLKKRKDDKREREEAKVKKRRK
jgi:hypothetical protein